MKTATTHAWKAYIVIIANRNLDNYIVNAMGI